MTKSTRFFTLAEANALLPSIKPLMASLLDHRAHAVRLSRELAPLLEEPHLDLGGDDFNELLTDFAVIEQVLEELKSYGCVVKSIDAGLIDFLAEVDGRPVYLCWRFGEERIEFYHELHAGYQGRTRLS